MLRKQYVHYQNDGDIRQSDAVPYPSYGEISAREAAEAKQLKHGIVVASTIGVVLASIALFIATR